MNLPSALQDGLTLRDAKQAEVYFVLEMELINESWVPKP